MKRAHVAGALAVLLGCVGDALPDLDRRDREGRIAQVRVTTTGMRGTRDAPLPFSSDGVALGVTIEVFDRDNRPVSDFNGYLGVSVGPGVLLSIDGPGVVGNYVRATNGAVRGVNIRIARGYGESRVWAEDAGYYPVDPQRDPRPACANGRDDDGDGYVDFPADTGCLAANDDNERSGSFAVGTSEPIYFDTPNISDVQGHSGLSPLEGERITLQGWSRPTPPPMNSRRHRMVVVQTDNSGFFVTDIDDRSCNGMPCYQSMYSFNFRSPDGMRPCDLLEVLTGSVTEFVSSTQLSQPGYQVGLAWRPNDPQAGPCLIPDPAVITAAMAADEIALERSESGLVRIENVTLPTLAGPGLAPNGVPMRGATNCDANNNGRIEFDGGVEEQCSAACLADVTCTEWSTWLRYGQVTVTLQGTGAMGRPARMAVAPRIVDPNFDPQRPRAARATFTGTLRQVGPNWIIQPRCGAEIVYEGMGMVRRPGEVCLHERSLSED